MNANARFALVLGAGLIFQAAVVPSIAIGSARPDIVLIIVATFGFLHGPGQGAVGGFIGGFLQDLMVPGSAGLEALVKTLVGYFSGQVERTILGNSQWMPMLAIGFVSFVSQFLFIGLAFLAGEPVELAPTLTSVILPSAFYTAVVGGIFFPRLSRLLSAERQAKVFR